MKLQKGWTTHMPMLIKVVQETDGSILELGSGLFSTPLLHWLCAEKRRKLMTYEDNEEFFEFAKKFKSRSHSVKLIKDWNEADIERKWSVVLIDHSINRRVIDALKVKDLADFVVLHDTEDPVYQYEKVWPHFKYRYDWKFCKPWTTVVSNFKDLSV